ncbi:MAG TPA: EamA family transporter [Anaerolineaceae bacterium]|nr:EamA family transporter [Anaerolineaceae bacterium]
MVNNNERSNSISPAKIWAALLAVYIVWGSTYLAIRFSVATIPPFLMAGVRFVIAGMILLIWRRAAGDPVPKKIHWRSAAIIGFFLLVGGNGGVVWAEQFVSSGMAALIVGSVPLWMLVMQIIAARGRWPRLPVVLGVLIGFGGLAGLLWPGSNNQTGGNGIASIVLVLAAVSWAVGSVYSKKAELPASPLQGTGLEMLTGGAGLLVLGLVTGEFQRIDINAISTQSLLGVGYLIIFGSLVGFAAYTWLLRSAPTSLVSTYAYVNPVIAIVIGHFLAGEELTARTVISAAIILGSVILITQTGPKTAPAVEAAD